MKAHTCAKNSLHQLGCASTHAFCSQTEPVHAAGTSAQVGVHEAGRIFISCTYTSRDSRENRSQTAHRKAWIIVGGAELPAALTLHNNVVTACTQKLQASALNGGVGFMVAPPMGAGTMYPYPCPLHNWSVAGFRFVVRCSLRCRCSITLASHLPSW